METGDCLGGKPAERTVLKVGQGLLDRVGSQAAGGGQFDEHCTAIAGAGAAGDVTASLAGGTSMSRIMRRPAFEHSRDREAVRVHGA
ncbi:hypothetical protein HRW07_02815 [Streptomyces lunaelactis]|nr:hypothetical protein [Streptomyces lunaelactis]